MLVYECLVVRINYYYYYYYYKPLFYYFNKYSSWLGIKTTTVEHVVFDVGTLLYVCFAADIINRC